MTEDEAKTKWCPFARTVSAVYRDSATRTGWRGDGGPSYNRLGTPPDEAVNPLIPESTNCLGSVCMAWRWANDYERCWDLPRDQPPEGEGWQHVEAIGGVAHWVRQTKTPHGFCGLAGVPQ